MSTYDFDLFVIGAGSGGVAGARRSGAYGARVGICEDSRVGGTCVHRGCVPKKLLVYGASYADQMADARGFGWDVPPATFDWASLIRSKDRELARLNDVYHRLLRDSGVTLVEGRGRMIDAHTVEVSGKTITAENILIATGSRPHLPRVPGIEHAITSNEALDLQAFPKAVVIVGGGYIGVEFAGIFRAAGASVTLLIRGDSVLRGFDCDVRAALTAELRKRGIDVRPEASVADIEKRDGGLSVMLRDGDTISADVVMYATGRVPNTRGLGLDAAGVALGEHEEILVDLYSRTNVQNVFAVGDCTNRKNLTPVAIAEARALAETLFRNRPTAIDHKTIASAVFSQPPVGTVGLGEDEARAAGHAVDVYVTSFRPMKHTLSGRDTRAMMKLVVDRETDRVLGCHMVGEDAPEIIQGFAVAVRMGARKADFDATVGIHPTAAEELVTMRERRPDPVAPASGARG